MADIKKETINGAKWAMINKCVMQPANFLYFMVLARLITPAEMGVLGLTGIFFALTNSLKEAGLGTALIRKQNRTEADCSTVFWFNIAANLLICLLFWIVAPWFAIFFNVPDLTWITRISAVMMVLNATQSVHFTLYSARRDFKTTTIISIITTLLSMPVTLYLAYTGWSYWSIVISGVFTGVLSLIIIWIVSPWKPRFIFSGKSFKEFFSFGIKLSLAGCVWNIYNEIVNFVIGKFYTPAQLALYTRANHVSQLPPNMLFEPINKIILPILSTIHDDVNRLNRIYEKFLCMCLLPMVFILTTLAINAHDIILFLYGKKWIECALYMQFLCIGFIFSPLIKVNNSYITVKGRSDLLLKRELNTRAVSLALMLPAAYYSVTAICVAFALSNVYNHFVTQHYALKLSKLSARQQTKKLIPYFVLSVLANAPSYTMHLLGFPYQVNVLLGSTIAFCLYIIALHVKRDFAYTEMLNVLWNSAPMRKLRTRFSS